MSDRNLMRGLSKAFGLGGQRTRGLGRWLGKNLGGSGLLRKELRHIFPDHWSFFIGEIALYTFIILVATGVYLALFFHASEAAVIYQGPYKPLAGTAMSDAYRSVLDLSFSVKAGLLIRQVHHWAALVFIGAVVVHLFRTFFTGAYRKPRWINWLLGLGLLLTAGFNGLMGYSLPDDLLSGVGLRIAFSITESIPFVGPLMATWLFGGTFPSGQVIARIYPVHIFLLPAAIAGLLGAHLGLLWVQRHTEFPGPGRSDRVVVGTPLIPAYALRTTGYLFLIAGGLTLLGALVQVNPIWMYGPFRPWDATTAAQPDWYMGWLEGAVRLFPAADIQIGWFLLPGIFWPAVVLPGLIFTPLFVWPWLDALALRDGDFHNLAQITRQRPGRTALGAGLLTFLIVLLVGGGDDVFSTIFGISLPTLVQALQVLVIVLPPIVAMATYLVFRRRAATLPVPWI